MQMRLEYNATIELVNVTGNSWTISHTGGSSSSDGEVIHGGGSICYQIHLID